jgi:uncharacterized OsmC-like protein
MTSHVEYLGELRTRSTHVNSGNRIETDAPKDNHGMGSRFSPTDSTANSLATCMITVMAIRAAKESIPFVNLYAEVTKYMASNPRRISKIEVSVFAGHEWTVDQKKLMEQVARNCPVALSLHPEIEQLILFNYEMRNG